MFKRFRLVRYRDVTGFSGTGVVAEGVQFTDGSAVVRWLVDGLPSSTVVWANVTEAVQVNGHDGGTVLEWVD